ncbi:hypothetical protein PYH37_002822 [Sinorhizobium numidicum]|uniref:Uncharacterized protein n=1 Tax=Sinorhizobium numidicum TaxID=680248 RepID=A0ABY8D2Q6_9HYPH|nr:hypothetical protein [Sinorhizobium numidicum]WEX77978.1 hypothetical protein PYH37_002822 [Sinorhizobium numidicum]WEX84637.1 hypothetical protein PYH38_003535 [Sinorhizobium numidicum]
MATDRLFDLIIDSLIRRGGADASRLVTEQARRPWMQRGVYDAAQRLGLLEGEAAAAMVYGTAFEEGALAALRLARLILSDPAVRGREAEALKLIEEGASHGDIVARLRVRKERSSLDSSQNNVVRFER